MFYLSLRLLNHRCFLLKPVCDLINNMESQKDNTRYQIPIVVRPREKMIPRCLRVYRIREGISGFAANQRKLQIERQAIIQ